jgi:hypothetical protein
MLGTRGFRCTGAFRRGLVVYEARANESPALMRGGFCRGNGEGSFSRQISGSISETELRRVFRVHIRAVIGRGSAKADESE